MIKMDKELANSIVTEADRLYRSIEDEDAHGDVQDFMDSTKEFLDKLVAALEVSGAAVDGVNYLDGRHLK